MRTTMPVISSNSPWSQFIRVRRSPEPSIQWFSSLIQLKEEEFICEWRLCPFTSRGVKEFLRHFHFHTFHAKIKTQGRSILLSHRQKPPIRPCSLDSSEVNILPDLSEEFICQWEDCQEPAFEEAQRYYWHVASHASYHSSLDHKTKGKPCRWHLCNTVVKTNSKLKDHLKFHSQERSVACPTCGNLFSNRVKFIDHCNRQLLPEDKSYACSYCSKTFAVERLLRDHVRSHINTKKCPLCPMTVTTNSNLRNHLRYRHSNVRQFPCSECSYAAKSNHDLQSHIRSLHGSPQIKCFLPKCDYICEDKEAFNTHLQDYHRDEPKFYVCHECDKRFERGQYLSRHLSRMHGVKLPRGHKRFRYLENPDGNYLLQVERFDFLAEDEEGPLEEEMEDEFSADDPDET
uniref:MBD2-interacting zinc finger protein n=1 Tax=Caligus clemensi TaxID=344056 RepID=C1C1N9_CALCM|nr:MBD2-interacting zinc finger protein [Caligus clemensi]